MKKTLLALLLVAAMLSSVAVTAFAADDTTRSPLPTATSSRFAAPGPRV